MRLFFVASIALLILIVLVKSACLVLVICPFIAGQIFTPARTTRETAAEQNRTYTDNAKHIVFFFLSCPRIIYVVKFACDFAIAVYVFDLHKQTDVFTKIGLLPQLTCHL